MTYAIIAPRWWWILFLIVLVATDDSMVCGFAVVRQPPNYHWSSLWDEGMTTRTTMHQRRWRVHRMTMTTNENSKSENATNAASIKSIATTKNSGSSNLKKEKNDDIKISLPPPEQVIGTKPSMVDIKTTTTKALRSSSFTLSSPPSSSTTTKKNLKIFPRYLEVECWKRQELRGLEPVLQAVAEACQQITRIVQRAQTDDMYGVAAATSSSNEPMENIQGEIQQKLDVLCNTIMMRTFCGSSRDTIQLIASEEEDLPRCCSDVMNDPVFGTGDFLAVFDPIDGSKNIDASLPVGTIFGIYKKPPGSSRTNAALLLSSTEDIEEALSKPFLQDGSALVAAGYCLYSATTVLVLTLGSGVDGFTLDPDTGKFLHTHKDIRIPSAGPIYSFNEANFHDFEEPVKRYLNALKEGSSSVGIRSNARYVGSLVADVHNILINGGIYGYPSTRQNPEGKLRLLYESAPMAMIMEQAGGAGSTGKHGRILNYMPTHIHQRVPTFLGSIENVFELDQFYKYYSDEIDE